MGNQWRLYREGVIPSSRLTLQMRRATVDNCKLFPSNSSPCQISLLIVSMTIVAQELNSILLTTTLYSVNSHVNSVK